MPQRTREVVAVTLAAALSAVVLTWPLAARFGSAGRVDSGDGRFSIWNVAWVAHALTSEPARLFDANIFHPHAGTLAFSEANLVAGALALPVWRLTANPLAASNWTILGAFILSFVLTYLLVRRLTGSRTGGGVAAFAFAFCPYVFSHIPHVQLLMTFGLPLVLLSMQTFIDHPGWWRAVGLGGAMALAGLACGYYGVFGGLMSGLGVAWFGVARGHWRRPRYWLMAFSAAGIAMLLMAPFFLPFLEIQREGFERSIDEARLYSVAWRSYFASPRLIDRWMLDLIGRWTEPLFPGFLSLILAATGLVVTFRRTSPPAERSTRAVAGFYVALAIAAVWASQGPKGGLYTVLYHTLPPFALLRAPARFGVLVTLACAVLAGFGAAALIRRIRPARRRAFVAALFAASLAGSTVGPLALFDAPPVNPVHRRLAALPRAPVVEFPYFSARGDVHRHTEYMLMSTYHWQPLVNGYSDYTPADALAARLDLSTFPGDRAWEVMTRLRVRYVVLHWHYYLDEGPRIRVAVARDRRLRLMIDTPRMSLYEVVEGERP